MSYQTLIQIADDLKQIIDNFWKLELTEQEMISAIEVIFSDANNRGLMMRGLNFKAGFERKLGKKRIDEIKRALIIIDSNLYQNLL